MLTTDATERLKRMKALKEDEVKFLGECSLKKSVQLDIEALATAITCIMLLEVGGKKIV